MSEDLARTLLEAAGLSPTDDEVTLLVAMYPILRERADVVHGVDLGYDV